MEKSSNVNILEVIRKYCRTCGKRFGENRDAVPVLNYPALSLWFQNNLNLEVNLQNLYPTSCCMNCLSFIKKWTQFKEKAQNQQKFFKKILDHFEKRRVIKESLEKANESLNSELNRQEITIVPLKETETKVNNVCDVLQKEPQNQDPSCHQEILIVDTGCEVVLQTEAQNQELSSHQKIVPKKVPTVSKKIVQKNPQNQNPACQQKIIPKKVPTIIRKTVQKEPQNQNPACQQKIIPKKVDTVSRKIVQKELQNQGHSFQQKIVPTNVHTVRKIVQKEPRNQGPSCQQKIVPKKVVTASEKTVPNATEKSGEVSPSTRLRRKTHFYGVGEQEESEPKRKCTDVPTGNDSQPKKSKKENNTTKQSIQIAPVNLQQNEAENEPTVIIKEEVDIDDVKVEVDDSVGRESDEFNKLMTVDAQACRRDQLIPFEFISVGSIFDNSKRIVVLTPNKINEEISNPK